MKLKTSEEFDVGSVIYFISAKTENVIPALVAEKIVRTSQSTSKITYVLDVMVKDGTKSVEVDPNSTDLFANPADVREFMLSRTTQAIDKLIENAVEAASVFVAAQSTLPSPGDAPREEFADGVLEDGKIAKLRM
jgi:hypothetical protein